MTLADLGDLMAVLALVYGAMLAVMALVEGRHLLTERTPRRRRRGVAAPPSGATAPDADDQRRACRGASR